MRITSRGRVTIPRQLREHLGLLPGTEVEFTVERGVAVLRPQYGARSRRIVGHLKSHGSKMRMSSRELLALLRDEPDEVGGR